jgi:hypothetical protein
MRARPLVVLLALACALALAPAAPASAQGPYRYAVITFRKNHDNTHRSTLVWRVFRVSGGTTTTVVRKSWRAGSGYFADSTNACRRNRGWLPSGRYRPTLFDDYHGNVIKGRAIYLGQKRCANGTMRRELFIHTEQGAGSRQCADRRGDQPCRWEYPKINDYRSYGCIKLSPGAMKELHDAWRRYFRAGYTDRVRVRVR